MILWRSGGKGWINELINELMNEWINDEAVYRTAPATPGLLNMFSLNFASKGQMEVCSIWPIVACFQPPQKYRDKNNLD